MKKYYINILMAGILWGGISLFVRKLSSLGFSPIEIVALRIWFATLLMGIYLFVKNKGLPLVHIRDIGLFLGTGIGSIVFFNYCYFSCMEISGVSIAAMLLYTAPAIVVLLSVPILKEKMTRRKLISLLVVCMGLVFITGVLSGKQYITTKSLLLGLGAGLGYALYSIFGKFLVKKYDSYTITFYTFIAGAVGIVPFIHFGQIGSKLCNVSSVCSSIGIAAFCTVLPYLFYTRGLEKVDSSKASILATIEPLVAGLIGIFVFKEVVTIQKVIGMLLILSASCFVVERK